MKEGDFVEIEYKGRIALTNEIFDLTSAEQAKKEGIFNEKIKYGPVFVIIGANMTIKGVEKQLETMKINDEKEFTVKPEQAFGNRIPKLIKIVSLSKFIEQKINPVPGIFVNIEGMQAKVQSVSGGRVRVDFNHPLAGKELKYNVKIVKQYTTTDEKLKVLLNHYNIKAKTELKEGKLTIDPEKPVNNFLEKLVSDTIKKWINDIKEVDFVKKEEPKK